MASLKFQIFKKIDSLKRFGQSKKEAKKQQKNMDEIIGQKTNSLRADGIFSKNTCDTYKRNALNFATWERQMHPQKEFKILDKIPREHVGEWLKEGIDKGESGYTTRLKSAAMAKIMDCHTYDFGIEMPSKKGDRLAIKRSRNTVAYDKHFSLENNKDIIDFCKATGLRRSELEQLRPEQITRDKENKLIIDLRSKKSYRVTTKGGRGRIVHPIREDWNIVIKAKEYAEKMGQDHVFNKVHHAMDVHSYRGIFAKRKYQETLADLKAKGKKIINNYICRDGSHRRFNKSALGTTSQNLGHKRLDVVVKNYLK
jgi:site-specific recombinase XerD